MTRFRYLPLLAGLCLTQPAGGVPRDSTDIAHGVREHASPAVRFVASVYENPSARPFAFGTSLTTLSLSGEYENLDEAAVPQKGSGLRTAGFQADSYLHLNGRSTAWGGAGYRFGRTMNVVWNESADYDLLYPYVMADSVGGDLSMERYSFRGGYARTTDRLSWGICADYRAQLEYRRKDPRPRNIVSDMKLSGGFSLALGRRYLLGASVSGRIYSQHNNVKIFSALGGPKIYQMLGLGMYSTRFSDGQTDLHHKGGGYAASIDFYSRDRQGLSLSVGYEDFFARRIMTGRNNLPLTRLDEATLRGEAAWRQRNGRHDWGVKLALSRSGRTGTEFVYGDGSGASNYPKIGEVDQFRNRRTALNVSGLWGYEAPRRWDLYIEPRGGLFSTRASYLSPSRRFEFVHAGGGAAFTAVKTAGRSLLHFSASADFRSGSDAELRTTGLDEESFAGQMLRQAFDNLASSASLYGIGVSWSYSLPRGMALLLSGEGRYGIYANGNRSRAAVLSCGLGF